MKGIIIIVILVFALSAYSQTDKQDKTYRDSLLLKQMARVRSVSVSISALDYASELKSTASNHISTMLSHWSFENPLAQPNANLHVVIRGIPWERKYQDFKIHYTGAEVEGVLSFSIGSSIVFEKSFKGSKVPFESIHSSNSYKNPSDAPFWQAFELSDFKSLLLDLTYNKGGLGDFIQVAAGLNQDPSPERLHVLMSAEIDPNVVLAELLRVIPRRDPFVEGAVLGEEYLKILEITLTLIEQNELNESIANELMALASDSILITSRNKYDGMRVKEIPRVSTSIKERAIALLGQLKYHEGVEDLILLLKHGGMSVRVSAANALGEIEDERALEPLIATLVSTWQKPLLVASYSALKSISKKTFGEDKKQWILWWESSTGRELVAYDDRGMSPLLVWIIIGVGVGAMAIVSYFWGD